MLNTPPSWWYATSDNPSFAARVLHPIGLLYGEIVKLRWRMQTPHCSSLPVICIGNFDAGGAGKTPLAIAVAEYLKVHGETPYFLSRGYGGNLSGPHLVNSAHDRVADVGDEPLLLVQHAPVVIARDRRAGADFIEKHGASVIVMDDGFQNPSLAKDMSLIAIDAQRGFGNGNIIPAGPLRAPVAFQKDLASAAVLLGEPADPVKSALADNLSGLPILTGRIAPRGDTHWLSDMQVIAYAGIGNPEKFFATLRELGAEILHARAFPDHHVYSESDAERLLGLADKSNLALVSTEKDAVRLRGTKGTVGALREKTRVLTIEIAFDATSRELLSQLITDALRSKRSR